MECLRCYNKEELIDIIEEYDQYVYRGFEDGSVTDGWTPVGVPEFIDWEYRDILEIREENFIEENSNSMVIIIRMYD